MEKPIKFITTRQPAVYEDPEIDDVLENNLPEPFTRENFYVFLKEQYAEESLEFYENVEELKAYIREKNEPVKKRKTNFNPQELEDKIQNLKSKIINTFVDSQGNQSINISGDVRKETIQRANSTDDVNEKVDIDPSMFNDAINEVKRLLYGDHFSDFLKKVKNQNMTPKAANSRILWGIPFLLLGFAITGGFVALAEFTDIKIFDSPFWRLLSMMAYFCAMFNILSGAKRFCPRLCTLEKYMGCPDHALADVWLGKVKCKLNHKVEYKGLNKLFKARAFKTWVQIIIATIVLTLISTLATPGTFYELK